MSVQCVGLDLVLMAESDEFFNRKVEEVEKKWKQNVLE